jgi:hypothetical protein
MAKLEKAFTPLGFGAVEKGLYRSAYPANKSLQFISALKLKSFVCLTPNDVKPELREFAEVYGIHIEEFDLKVNQEPFLVTGEDPIKRAVAFITGLLYCLCPCFASQFLLLS